MLRAKCDYAVAVLADVAAVSRKPLGAAIIMFMVHLCGLRAKQPIDAFGGYQSPTTKGYGFEITPL